MYRYIYASNPKYIEFIQKFMLGLNNGNFPAFLVEEDLNAPQCIISSIKNSL
jgi:hypothetical protein